MAGSGLVVAGLRLAIRLVWLAILCWLVIARLPIRLIILARLALRRNGLVIISLRRRTRRLGASVFELAYALTYTPE